MNIVFLDIDGVIQPYNAQARFYMRKEDCKNTLMKLETDFPNTDYSQYDISDVIATLYDWNNQAVARIKYILDSTNSKIIVSSDWRSEKLPNKMHDLLQIHNLGDYWYKDNIILRDFNSLSEIRHLEIEDSLKKYPIDNYVIIDDMKELYNYYLENTIITNNYISISDMNDCIKILKKTK